MHRECIESDFLVRWPQTHSSVVTAGGKGQVAGWRRAEEGKVGTSVIVSTIKIKKKKRKEIIVK